MERNRRKAFKTGTTSCSAWRGQDQSTSVRLWLNATQLHGEEDGHEDHRRDSLHLVRCRRGRNGSRESDSDCCDTGFSLVELLCLNFCVWLLCRTSVRIEVVENKEDVFSVRLGNLSAVSEAHVMPTL